MDIFSREKRSEIMSKIRSKNTKPEETLRKALFHRGFRYRKNYKKLPGKPDIAFLKAHLAVFVHGCFWHQHPDCKYAALPKSNQQYWIPKLKRNSERDDQIIQQLQTQGWNVIILWECELKKDFENQLQKIILFLEGDRKSV